MAISDFQEIISDFNFLEDWEDRYRYIIDLGKKLEPLEASLKNETTKVAGCASQVWLAYEFIDEGTSRSITFKGDSEAIIVKGLVAIILILFNGEKIIDAKNIDPEMEFKKLGLDEHLSSQRSNGLRSMLNRITHVIRSN